MAWTVDVLDLRVAERLCALVGADDPSLVTVAALAAAAPRGGHVCVDLAAVADDVEVRVPPPAGSGERPEPRPLAPVVDPRALLGSAVRAGLARRGEDRRVVAPLVVDGTRVYLDRYWAYEDRLLAHVVRRGALARRPADPAGLRAVLDGVAPHDPSGPTVDRQRLAVANGLIRPLSVISGGPGTGKTHTIVSLLVAHLLHAEARGVDPPRIAIAAPTGKAAARMEQAILEAVERRSVPSGAAAVLGNLRGHTLHRLLGWQRRSPTRFRHDADAPLPHQLVVVDEASMVPLSLMAKLVDATRPAATLVLVGDRDQLTSVEAGAVLGDICGPRPEGSSLRLSDEWCHVLAEVTGEDVDRERHAMPAPGVWDGIVQLERFHRFGPETGIGAVARAVQRVTDDPSEVILHLTGRGSEPHVEVEVHAQVHDDVELIDSDPGPALPVRLRSVVTDAFGPYLDAVGERDAGAALDRLDALRVLCAVREGPLGVDAVGRVVERWVAEDSAGRLRPGDEWYAGRPVLVTRNDHDLGVMNGDVGVTLRGDDGRLVVAFRVADGTITRVPTVRVADCETVWAMTIHVSQGSQYDHVVVVLPDREAEVVTRELVYTGITRARRRATVVARPERLGAALTRPVRRATGLRERLWGTTLGGPGPAT